MYYYFLSSFSDHAERRFYCDHSPITTMCIFLPPNKKVPVLCWPDLVDTNTKPILRTDLRASKRRNRVSG
jgi:hypothetical protein